MSSKLDQHTDFILGELALGSTYKVMAERLAEKGCITTLGNIFHWTKNREKKMKARQALVVTLSGQGEMQPACRPAITDTGPLPADIRQRRASDRTARSTKILALSPAHQDQENDRVLAEFEARQKAQDE